VLRLSTGFNTGEVMRSETVQITLTRNQVILLQRVLDETVRAVPPEYGPGHSGTWSRAGRQTCPKFKFNVPEEIDLRQMAISISAQARQGVA